MSKKSSKGGKGKNKGKGGDDDQEMIEKVARMELEMKALQERLSSKFLKKIPNKNFLRNILLEKMKFEQRRFSWRCI